MNYSKIFILLLFVLFNTSESYRVRRVSGGQPINRKLPWAAFIKKLSGVIFCGGVVVSNNEIITAAHCFDNNQIENSKVCFGININELECIKIESIIKHPEYTINSPYNDIAILKLRENITIENACNIRMPNDNEEQELRLEITNKIRPMKSGDKLNGTMKVIGFGDVGKEKSGNKDYNVGPLNVLPNNLIRSQLLGGFTNFTETDTNKLMFGELCEDSKIVCAASANYDIATDSCSGDSGGPILWQSKTARWFRVIGLVSAGTTNDCGDRDNFGVYISLFAKEEWILQNKHGSNLQDCYTMSPRYNPINGANTQSIKRARPK
ncbi:putative serine protease [Carp edema virus]|nr:putative serine protease [Carp edema virus]